MDALTLLYEEAKQRSLDINEHLDRLRELAAQVETVTEFGVRDGFGSTVAFLQPKHVTLTSFDIAPCPNGSLLHRAAEGRWHFYQDNTLTMPMIAETGMLFIDSLHTYEQLRAELVRHGNQARHFLAFHDTGTFGWRGEDGSLPGLWDAIIEFCLMHRHWRLIERRSNCNGLIVLERDHG